MLCCVVFCVVLCCGGGGGGGGGGKNPKFAEKMLWPRVFGGPQLQVPDFFQESRRAAARHGIQVPDFSGIKARAQLRVKVRVPDFFRNHGARALTVRFQNIVGKQVKGAGASAHIATTKLL